MASPQIGILGLGIIGSIWARHYAAAGLLGGAWNRTAQPDFPQWRATPAEVVANCDVIQIVVADPAAVRGVFEQIVPELGPGKTVVQSSTIDPESSISFRDLVTVTGARYLEAPFTGSRPAAEAQQSVFYFGGDASLIAELEPFFSHVSSSRFHIGTEPQAASLKLAMNLNIAAQLEALCESLTLCRRAGISDDVFFDALGKNVSYSGLTKLKEAKLRAGDYAPQFSVKHMLKDLRLAATTAGADDYTVLAAAQERFAAAAAAGFAEEDMAAILRLL